MQELFGNLWNLQWQQVVMWGIGGLLIWLAIKKEMEPSLLLGLTVASKMQAEYFLNRQTLMILALGLVAFVFDTIGGVLVAKVYNLFAKQKINPMIGAAGISAFPMSARVVNKMGLQEDNQNFLLMHAVGVNVSGQIASVIAGGMILTLFA